MSDSCARPGLRSVEETRAALLAAAVAVDGIDQVSLVAAYGRVLAADQLARVDVPPAPNSAMDGYALCLASLRAAGGALPLSQRIPAGAVPQPLAEGTAARIFTGAELPPGADTVVMQEDCSADGQRVVVAPETVAALKVGDNVRPRGQDMAVGTCVVAAGTILGPEHVGVLAAAGHAVVPVRRRLRVAILSTGDELLEPGEPPAPGRIYNSNRYALSGYLLALGCEVLDRGVIADRREATEQALREAAAIADVVVTSGGASVGEEDHLGAALRAVGRVEFWKVAIKPGKPVMFGHVEAGTRAVPVLGLPGNPVSVAVTLLALGVPFLRALQGVTPAAVPSLRVAAGFRTGKPGGRTEYLRVRRVLTPDGLRLARYPNQSSGVLTSLAWADGLAVVPAGVAIAEGDPVEYLPFPRFPGE